MPINDCGTQRSPGLSCGLHTELPSPTHGLQGCLVLLHLLLLLPE